MIDFAQPLQLNLRCPSRLLRVGFAVVCVLGTGGCSESSNILGLIAKPWTERDAEAQLSRSEILFDAGDYSAALEAAEKAFELAPKQDRIAIHLSYVHLAMGGLDLFRLARSLIEDEGEAEASLLESAGGAAGQLASLAKLVGLSNADYSALTLPDNRLGELEGAPSIGPFRSLPVLLPKTAPEARVSASPTMGHITRAVEVLCPFVPARLKLLGEGGDIRHTAEACASSNQNPTASGKAFFIWAMSHLVEAVAFHQVVLYQPEGDRPYLQRRSEILKDPAAVPTITEFVQSVQELSAVIDIIMPTEAGRVEASMLTAMFNDLETVSRTFEQMPGVPASLKDGIIEALVELRAQREKVQAGDSSDRNSVVLKDQLMSGLAKELGGQIQAKAGAGQLSEQEKTDVCRAYRSISSESLSVCSPSAETPAQLPQ